MSIFQLKSPISRISSNVSLLLIIIIYGIMHNAPSKGSFMHVNNGSNSHQELKDFVHITYSTIQTLKNTKAVYMTLLFEILPCSRCLYGDIPWNSIFREFSADGRFFVFGVTLLLACEQQTHFRSSLLSLRKIERSDDRKCVCCSQATCR